MLKQSKETVPFFYNPRDARLPKMDEADTWRVK